ncbi:MAG: peptidylprolyl isomerase [Elusimicrobiaceae bacterium]|nr:peptidylprolyl isomerase [Elusimicrobiaceae bacterium]
MMKKCLYLFVAAALCACHKPQENTPAFEPPTAEKSSTVTEQDVQDRLELLSKQDYAFAQTPIGRQNLLQTIVREKLILADAQANGLDKTPDYQTFSTQKRQQLAEIYQAYLQRLLEDLWYQHQRDSGALQVSEEEIADYYKKYPYEMTVKQIIIDNAETAEQVLRTLKGSPRRWAEMERQYSIAPEAIRAKNFTFMPGEFLPEIEVIAANSSSGSVQGFIKTALGFHIIMKTGEKRLSKQEAAARIRTVLENKKLDEILESLQTKYEVTVYDKNE